MCNQPTASLDAATTTGPGAAADLGRSLSLHTLVRTTTGSPTSMNVDLEGSQDGVNWFVLGSITNSSTTPQVINGLQRAVRYVRANLTSLSGGTSPTVTATIASVEA